MLLVMNSSATPTGVPSAAPTEPTSADTPPHPPPTDTAGRTDSRVFVGEETTLICLNLAVLAALVLVHVAFRPIIGVPSRGAILAVTAVFLVQTVEMMALQSARLRLTPRVLAVYPRASVLIKLLLAFMISSMAGLEDSHYAVLMVLPVVAAAFRTSVAETYITAGIAWCLNYVQLWIYFREHPPVEPLEFFEATTVGLIYVAVAAVVASLSDRLRRERHSLAASLEELRRTKDLLVQEEKLAAVGRLSAAIAHEIRNPVAAIVSSTKLARSRTLCAEEREQMCTIVAREAQRLEALTGEFLAYARERKLDLKRFDAADLLGYLRDVVRARAEERRIAVRTRWPSGLSMTADLFQLQQAVMNLLLNGIEASREGATILLEAGMGPARPATSTASSIVLSVENQGDPVPAAMALRIFEPFFSTKQGGTGLGLAIAQKIARAHGGDLVLSRNADGVVRFDLVLPQEPLALQDRAGAATDPRYWP